MSENYDYIEIIGQGMYGRVYKALNKIENKYYAIKCLNFKDITEKERKNIEMEVNLLKELKHPNIVLYKDSFLDKENNLNIVTTFCEGGDMYQKIFKEKNKYFDENKIINWLIQLLLGLSYIHDKQIVHRDIKTKNIFIQNEHTLRIGDFGIAKIFKQAQTMNKLVGTPLYMAPECFKQAKKFSYKSDIWSLGCCIYEMCNLKHAFEGKFFPAVSVKISEGKRAPLNKIYSRDLKDLVDSMLDLNPRHRPTIANILERPFMKIKVGEYIMDFINNYKKYDGTEEQINILNEQAEKFQIFKININNEINNKIIDIKNKINLNNNFIDNNNDNKNYKLKDKHNIINNLNKNNNSKKNIKESEIDKMGYTRQIHNNEEKKRMNFKKNLSPSQQFDFKDKKYSDLFYRKNKDNSKNNIKKINPNENSKSKKDINQKELTKNQMKENNYIKDKKNQKLFLAVNNEFGFPGRKTDIDKNNKKTMSKQQSTENYNFNFVFEYNENQENIKRNFNNNLNFKNNNYFDHEDNPKNEKKIDKMFNNVNDLNKNCPNDYNNNLGSLENEKINKEIDNNEDIGDKSFIINKRINFFKERCVKSLGKNFYNKAYNFLKNDRKNNFSNKDKIREHLSNTFGKNHIGYWQLIDQILLLEDILEKS